MFGLFDNECDLPGNTLHRNWHIAAGRTPKMQRQNGYMVSRQTAGVGPCHARRKLDSSSKLCLVVNQLRVIKIHGSVEGGSEPLCLVMIESHRTVLLEECREEFYTAAQVCLVIVAVHGDSFISLASGVKPLKQSIDCVR